MLSPWFFRNVISSTLNNSPFPDHDRAVQILTATALHESMGLRYDQQLGGGPALGFFQMEPGTAADHLRWVCNNARASLWIGSVSIAPTTVLSKEHLQYDLPFQIALARVHYYTRSRLRLPDEQDIEAQASYWKECYNTKKGRGKPEQFIQSWMKYAPQDMRDNLGKIS